MPFVECLSIVLFACILYRLIQYYRRSKELSDVTSRYIFITGCDTGFGNILAKSLDSKGIHVFAGCLTDNGANELQQTCSKRIRTVIIDVTKAVSIDEAEKYIRGKIPLETGLWGLVNNAGVMPNLCPVEWLRLEEIKEVCNVNLFGCIGVTLKFLPLIRMAKGRIVNVSSIMGASAYPGTTDYCVSKAGIKMFSTCLRRELYRTGVTVHSIEPGGFATQICNYDRLRRIFLKAYKKTTEEKREYYGGNIAAYFYKLLNGPQVVCKKTYLVAEAMEHALTARYPKDRYIVGPDANFFFGPLAALPDIVGDIILGWPAPYGPKAKELENE